MATSEQGDLHPNNADGKTSENSIVSKTLSFSSFTLIFSILSVPFFLISNYHKIATAVF